MMQDLAVSAVFIAYAIGVLMTFGLVLTWVERKEAAIMSDRIGANRAYVRVPFTQGQEFYRALDRRGVPTEMIVYPRTPHGPREPKFLMDVTGRILTWFREHLGEDAVTAQGG